MNNALDIVGIRLVKENKIMSDKALTSPEAVIELVANELKLLDRETLMSINLDTKLKNPVGHIVCVGSVNEISVDMKSIFKAALLSNSSNIILIHNHPSGDYKPSKYDLEFTNKVKEACKLLDMSLIDHIIIGFDKCYSICLEQEISYENNYRKLNSVDNDNHDFIEY